MTILSCSEIMPIIPEPRPPEEINRKVIIEEFTGVTCVNCPAGSAEIENLLAIYGDNLIPLSIHAGFFAEPDPSRSTQDFRTDAGDFLIGFLGEPQGYPSAVIDRKLLNGSNTLQQSPQGVWAGLIDQELALTAPLSMLLDTEYDDASREMLIEVSGIWSESLSGNINLTVMIAENDIVEPQLTPDGWDFEYKHKHALRDIVTGNGGDALASSPRTGDDYSQSYRYTLPEEYDAAAIDVIVFAHLVGEQLDILQAESTRLLE